MKSAQSVCANTQSVISRLSSGDDAQ